MSAYSVYERLPTFGQNIACTLYGLKQRYIFYGPGFGQYYRSLLRTQQLSSSEIEDLQLSLLDEIIEHAYLNVPYYRRLFERIDLLPKEIESLDDLRRIPLLEKETVRSHPEDFWADNIPLWQIREGRTSGTTGVPMRIRHTRGAVQKVWAAMERLRNWGGVSRYDRRVSFTGKMFVPTSRPADGIYWRHDWAGKRLLFSVYHLNPTTCEDYVEKLREFNPSFIDGYPAAIYEIASFMLKHNISPPTMVEAIFPTAEMLTSDMRSAIEEAFDARVHNQYGATELACHAGECEYGTMHVSPEIGIVEIIDDQGQPVEEGEFGELVLTGLVNYAMPLIRYRIGDTAVRGSENHLCKCGRHLPSIERLTGRLDDLVITTDGREINILNYHMFKWADHVVESQVIQEDYGSFRIRVVKDNGFRQEELDRAIEELHRRVGKDINVEIEFLTRIPRTDRGKFRPVVSKVEK
jgi:phenylacetate-CoA ligase